MTSPAMSPSKHLSPPATGGSRFTRSASLTPTSLKGAVLATAKMSAGKKDKSSKEKRRSRKTDVASAPSNSQWYAMVPTDSSPVFELRQELTPKRPLRSEVEKERRLSRPSSGQFLTRRFSLSTSQPRLNGGASVGSNRDSIGTTDSTASEEDAIPPPLPVKIREADYCNLPDEEASVEVVRVPTTPRLSIKPVLPEPVEKKIPPTPPPKRHLKLPSS